MAGGEAARDSGGGSGGGGSGGGGSGSGSGSGGGEGGATGDVADVERAASNIARLWQAEPVASALGEARELSPQQMATSEDVPCHEGESGCCVYTTAELEAVWPLVRVRGRVRGRANQVWALTLPLTLT